MFKTGKTVPLLQLLGSGAGGPFFQKVDGSWPDDTEQCLSIQRFSRHETPAAEIRTRTI
jgi:hypothetical protein